MFLYAQIYWLAKFGDVSCLQLNYLRVETHSDLGGFCWTIWSTILRVKSDKTLCPTWEYDRWYTWRDLYAPSSKITQTNLTCLFLSYYSLLIIWHVVQCFWFQTSIKCTRKWRNLLKSETNTETETNFRILPIFFLLA
jgi:hypothetical protein